MECENWNGTYWNYSLRNVDLKRFILTPSSLAVALERTMWGIFGILFKSLSSLGGLLSEMVSLNEFVQFDKNVVLWNFYLPFGTLTSPENGGFKDDVPINITIAIFMGYVCFPKGSFCFSYRVWTRKSKPSGSLCLTRNHLAKKRLNAIQLSTLTAYSHIYSTMLGWRYHLKMWIPIGIIPLTWVNPGHAHLKLRAVTFLWGFTGMQLACGQFIR